MIEDGSAYVRYCAGTRARAEDMASVYRFRPTQIAGYFLEVEQCGVGDVVLRHLTQEFGPGWLLFSDPCEVIIAACVSDVPSALARASEHAERGGYSAGFLSYESGPAFDAALAVKAAQWPVLAWFALYDRAPKFFRELAPVYDSPILELGPSDMSPSQYRHAFAKVHEALAAGESYQVNLTFRQPFCTTESPARFFSRRCGVNPPIYASFVDGGEWQIASFSPELLFERAGDDIETRPMKGTAPVPTSPSDWTAAIRGLTEDPKSRAENIMIVDMARNDLGAIAEPGSVMATRLLEVERHRGLLQMTSTVRARSSVATPDLMAHLFPAASITGAPKVATTRIIRSLEHSPRHIYCGSIGGMGPGWQRFSVAIRTALFRDGGNEFGIGSGLVWDSDAESEYEECLAKRELLLTPGEPWVLIEALATARLGDDSYVERHTERLAGSAAELGISFDRAALNEALSSISGDHSAEKPSQSAKLRVALRRDGKWTLAIGASQLPTAPLKAILASHAVGSADPNFRFKTNSREVLQRHLDEHPGFDEVLLYNERGELTEFCRGNLVAHIDGHLYTPPFHTGCLPGLKISEMIEAAEVEVRLLTVDDLPRCERFLLTNSVVGAVEVLLERTAA